MKLRACFQASFAVGLLAFTSLPASAHSRPKAMSPEAGSTVTAPSELSVYFTEALEPKFSSLQLTDQKGTVLNKQHAVLDARDNKHLTLALPALASGMYHVHWTSSAVDGHRLDGDYSFTVK